MVASSRLFLTVQVCNFSYCIITPKLLGVAILQLHAQGVLVEESLNVGEVSDPNTILVN